MSDDPASKDLPFERRSADHLPYGVHTIVIPFTWSSPQDLPPEGRPADHLPYGADTIIVPFTWSNPQRPRLPSGRFGGPNGVTGCPPPDYVGQGSVIAERQFAMALKDVQQTSTELALSALQTLRESSHSLHPHGAGTAAATDAGLSTSGSTSNGGVMLVNDKVGGKDDPSYELRKNLGEETPEEDIEHHHGIDPLQVPGIPPGGGALPFGPGRLDAGSSPQASRTASPKPSPPAQPAAPIPTTSATPASSTPAARLPSPPPPAPPPAPDKLVRALPGHGNDRHGTQTTTAQQTTRVQTGRAPDGRIAPTATATRFDSPEAQLDAVKRAQARTAARDASGLIPHTVTMAPNGAVRLPRDQSVVTGYPGGYGSGVQLQKPVAPGRPVVPTGQLPNALVVLEWEPRTGQWRPVTQYPTDKPVTP